MTPEVINAIVSMGPIGFGTVIFVVIWKVVIAPQILSQQAQSQAILSMVDSMRTLISTQSSAQAQAIRDNQSFQAAQTKALDMIVLSMDTLVDRMIDMKHEGLNNEKQ